MANLLMTGGAGYIGSHTCLTLLEQGHVVVVIDDFSNGSVEALNAVATLAKLQNAPSQDLVAGCNRCWRWRDQNNRYTTLILIEGDIRRAKDLQLAFEVLAGEPIKAVMHFAGLKAVAESVAKPLDYWDVNVAGSRQLLDVMAENHCYTVVFSSSATVYGLPKQVPISESQELNPINPYGRTKVAVEQMLYDLATSAGSKDPGWRVVSLRYFNPVGAHESGKIGEDPDGTPSNLLPLICKVASGQIDKLQIFGSDWPTEDGTAIRDYIHVMDLAEAHSVALRKLLSDGPQLLTLNLGSGKGHSVLEMVREFERTNGVKIPYVLCGRRPGDSAVSVADPREAQHLLGWRTRRDLPTICRDTWHWQQTHPAGYDS